MKRAASRLASLASTIRPRTTATTNVGNNVNNTVSATSTTTTTTTTTATAKRSRHTRATMDSSQYPLSGLYKPNSLQGLYYGPNTVQQHLLSCLPSEKSKAFIVTGNTLYNKTPLIKDLEKLLGPDKHAGTFASIKQHAPVAQLDEATDKVFADESIDTIISVGGGSPIDSAKAISYRLNERKTKSGSDSSFLCHIAIPTTLSAAECTSGAGYTQSDGVKTGIRHPSVYPTFILYDSKFALHTPPDLFISTGIRALDHAVELQYQPQSTLMPTQLLTQLAFRDLFIYLPRYKSNPKDEQVITRLMLTAYASLGFLGANTNFKLGLSHSLGYALGSPYNIPHGITSCLTLGHVVKLKAQSSSDDAKSLAALLPYIPSSASSATGQTTETRSSGNDVEDAIKVGDAVLRLVQELGLKTTLTEKGVGRDQVDIIVKRATGGLGEKEGLSNEEKKLVAGVRTLVEKLY